MLLHATTYLPQSQRGSIHLHCNQRWRLSFNEIERTEGEGVDGVEQQMQINRTLCVVGICTGSFISDSTSLNVRKTNLHSIMSSKPSEVSLQNMLVCYGVFFLICNPCKPSNNTDCGYMEQLHTFIVCRVCSVQFVLAIVNCKQRFQLWEKTQYFTVISPLFYHEWINVL